MKTVLFDILLANGHLNPSFDIASTLREDGYNVVYLTNTAKKEYIERAGFATEVVKGNIFRKGLITEKKDIFSLAKAIIKDKVYHLKRKYFFIKLKEYQVLLDKISPSLIILDAHCFSRILIYEKGKFPVIKLNTTLPNQKRKYIAPLNIYHLPTFDFKGYLLSELYWKYSTLKNFSQSLFQKIILLNQDVITNWLYYAKELNFSKRNIQKIRQQEILDLSISGYKEVFLHFNKYDFYELEDKNSYFYKITLKRPQANEISNNEYQNLLGLIKSNKYNRIIYCSLGTIGHLFRRKYIHFFNKMKVIANLNPSYLFIFSGGGKITTLSSNISNLLVYNYLPQIDLLGHVDMMISHGGMNGITECILTQTPVLVVRVHNKTDNQGCAARVVYHRLGLSAKASDSPENLSEKISMIIAEKENIKKRMEKIKMENQENLGYRLIKSYL